MIATIDLGIILNVRPYQSKSRIVKIFTKEAGLITLFFAGSKKGKQNGGMHPLAVVEVEYQKAKKGSMFTLKQLQPTTSFFELQTNVVKTSLAFFYAELLLGLLHEGEKQEALFKYCADQIFGLEEIESCSHVALQFAIGLTTYLGFHPDTKTAGNYFNWKEGVFQGHFAQQDTWEKWASDYLRETLLHETSKLKIAQRSALMDMLMNYYRYHLEGFQTPQSLAIAKEVLS